MSKSSPTDDKDQASSTFLMVEIVHTCSFRLAGGQVVEWCAQAGSECHDLPFNELAPERVGDAVVQCCGVHDQGIAGISGADLISRG